MAAPDTHYAWNGDVCLAYQVVGDGPVDLLYLQGYCSQVDLNWDSAYLSRFLRGLGRRSRLIVTDRRGWGCSDRFSSSLVPDIDTLTDDLLVVLDAVGSDRAAIMASSECGLIASLFAASYPDRTAALILVDAYPTYSRTEETPWAPTPEEWEEAAEEIAHEWGTRAWLSPRVERWTDDREIDWYLRYMRASTTPAALAAEIRRFVGTDIRSILSTIQTPALVFVDTEGEWESRAEGGRYLASHVPNARLVEHTSSVGLHRLHWYSRGDAIVEETSRFLADVHEQEAIFDRVLATVLFTDIVGSTSNAAAMGDRRWRQVREQHDAIVRSQLARYRGREVKTMGDGFLATFDGPARAVRCAIDVSSAVRRLGIELRCGLHTGEVELEGEDVAGVAVAVGARIGAIAGPSEVLVSSTVKDLVVGSGIGFEPAGERELKGLPGTWQLFRATL